MFFSDKAYAGIGARATPVPMLHLIERVACRLALRGWVLRTGGASGADTAWENGAASTPGAETELFLPWQGFNQRRSPFSVLPEAYALAAEHHPYWQHLKDSERSLMARNAHQILGRNLDDPVRMVLCWTEDGCETAATRSRRTGGTGLAISLADSMGIPVFNLRNTGALDRVARLLEGVDLGTEGQKQTP